MQPIRLRPPFIHVPGHQNRSGSVLAHQRAACDFGKGRYAEPMRAQDLQSLIENSECGVFGSQLPSCLRG